MPGKNDERKPEDRIVHWGKYSGKRFSEVPKQYLIWFAGNAFHQMKARKQWAIDELRRRGITYVEAPKKFTASKKFYQ